MPQLVLIRHGESSWNHDNRFTGWADVDLTARGAAQMQDAAAALMAAGWWFDVAYSSVLRRCIRSQWLLMDAMDCMWVPLVADWRLNERHYGALTGMDKIQAGALYGAEQVQRWRRSYDAQPPPYRPSSPELPAAGPSPPVPLDRRYQGVPAGQLPASESLQQTAMRVQTVWDQSIAGALRAGRRVLIMAHGNSLRALAKQLEGISDTAITGLEVPNAVPWLYELDAGLKVLDKRILNTPNRTVSEIL